MRELVTAAATDKVATDKVATDKVAADQDGAPTTGLDADRPASPDPTDVTVPPAESGPPESSGGPGPGWARDAFVRDYRDGMRALLARTPDRAAGHAAGACSDQARTDGRTDRLLHAAAAALLLGDVRAARAAGARALAAARDADCPDSRGPRGPRIPGLRRTARRLPRAGTHPCGGGCPGRACGRVPLHGRQPPRHARPGGLDRGGHGHGRAPCLGGPYHRPPSRPGPDGDPRGVGHRRARPGPRVPWRRRPARAGPARPLPRPVPDDRADDLYLRALALHDERGGDFERARTELLHGRWLRRRRRLREARSRLGAALVGFERCGAGAWADQTRGELRANGAASVTEAAGGLSRLTPQQLRIARYVAEGATNREVAQRLAVSTRTVDYHLRNVFAALGVRSRMELARMVDQESR
ncbi:hypothetical protein SVIOM74S_06881 [Streptomyces violarus]